MKIKFCGAAKSVTGSCHLISTEETKVLLDCGQFQGGKEQEKENYMDFPFEPNEIDAMVLSHGHIDHCGRIPLLIKRGFAGTIFCTDATADLLQIMLKDAAHIQEKEAEWQNKRNLRAGRPTIEPLYTMKEAEEALKHIQPVMYDQLIQVTPQVQAVFNDAGHILGSAITELWVKENEKTSKVVFSGDIGVKDRPILRDPKKIKKADYVIMETTYGSRLHPQNSMSIDALYKIIIDTTNRGGSVIIPSFAVGRTQELIFELNRMYEENQVSRRELENINVYIDSPMATAATEVFKNNAQVFDQETKEYILKGDNPLDFKNLKFTRTTEESISLNENREPKVIISASGMCEAGRIRHHLKHNLWDKNASIVFVGYQAEGTLGKAIVDGIKEVTLFGEQIQINAEIHNLEGFSGHADRDGLLDWLSGFEVPPKQLFLVHGEESSKIAFGETVKEKLGYESTVIKEISEYEIETGQQVGNLDVLEEFAKGAELNQSMYDRIAAVHKQIDNLLYNTSQVIASDIELEKKLRINNNLMDLENRLINLGSEIYDEK